MASNFEVEVFTSHPPAPTLPGGRLLYDGTEPASVSTYTDLVLTMSLTCNCSARTVARILCCQSRHRATQALTSVEVPSEEVQDPRQVLSSFPVSEDRRPQGTG